MEYTKHSFFIICACLFYIVVTQLSDQYQSIRLENNKLYNKPQIQRTNLQQILSEQRSRSLNIFYSIEGRIRAFYSTNYEHIRFPLYEGRLFTVANTKEALVGGSVETKWKNNQEYITYKGQEYAVIGKLGRSSESNLYYDVVLNDSDYFMTENEVFVVDEQGTESFLQQIFAINQIQTMSQRDNSHVFFQGLSVYGCMLLILTSIIVAILFWQTFVTQNWIIFLSGIPKHSIRLQNIKVMSTVLIISSALAALIAYPYVPSYVINQFYVFSTMFGISIIGIYYVLSHLLWEESDGIVS